MDHIRQDLDELMGKDRNHPLHVRLRKRDHFDDEQVTNMNFSYSAIGVQVQPVIVLSTRFVPEYQSRFGPVIFKQV
jgi:hypothetical protein